MESRQKYNLGQVTEKLRSDLSKVIYGWNALYPQPMTDFSQGVCLHITKDEFDALIPLIKTAMGDSNNIFNLSQSIMQAVDDYSNNKFNYDAFKNKLTNVANQTKHLDEINRAKALQMAINVLVTGQKLGNKSVIDLNDLNGSRAKISAAMESEKKKEKPNKTQLADYDNYQKALDHIENSNTILFGIIKEELAMSASLNAKPSQMYAGKIDELIRDSNVYASENFPNSLEQRFKEARKDIPKLNELGNEIERMVKEIGSQRLKNPKYKNLTNKDDEKLVTVFLTKYPAQKPEKILEDLHKQYKAISENWKVVASPSPKMGTTNSLLGKFKKAKDKLGSLNKSKQEKTFVAKEKPQENSPIIESIIKQIKSGSLAKAADENTKLFTSAKTKLLDHLENNKNAKNSMQRFFGKENPDELFSQLETAANKTNNPNLIREISDPIIAMRALNALPHCLDIAYQASDKRNSAFADALNSELQTQEQVILEIELVNPNLATELRNATQLIRSNPAFYDSVDKASLNLQSVGGEQSVSLEFQATVDEIKDKLEKNPHPKRETEFQLFPPIALIENRVDVKPQWEVGVSSQREQKQQAAHHRQLKKSVSDEPQRVSSPPETEQRASSLPPSPVSESHIDRASFEEKNTSNREPIKRTEAMKDLKRARGHAIYLGHGKNLKEEFKSPLNASEKTEAEKFLEKRKQSPGYNKSHAFYMPSETEEKLRKKEEEMLEKIRGSGAKGAFYIPEKTEEEKTGKEKSKEEDNSPPRSPTSGRKK